jgi:hypothetical protein
MAVCHPRDAKDEWDIMTWLLLVHKISFRRTIRIIRYLIIVTILKSWNSCHKGTNLILRIGLGSHEFGVPLLVHLSLWVEFAGPSGRRPRSSVAPPQSGAAEKQTCTWPPEG